MFMAKKVIEAVKKAVTKKPAKKEVKKEVKITVCMPCDGRGLESPYALCSVCHGSGQV